MPDGPSTSVKALSYRYLRAIQRLDSDLGELLARHERGRDLSEFGRYADDPVGFIRDVLHGEPWSRQVEIAEAVRDAPLVVVRSANAVGKDWTAGHLALWWTYARGGLVLVTGPTERQVVEVVMGEVAAAFRQAKDLLGDLYRTALRVGDRAAILAFTSTGPLAPCQATYKYRLGLQRLYVRLIQIVIWRCSCGLL